MATEPNYIDSKIVELIRKPKASKGSLSPDTVIKQCQEHGIRLTKKGLQFYLAEGLVSRPDIEYEPGKPGRRSYYLKDTVERIACIHVAKKRYGWHLGLIRTILDAQKERGLKNLILRLEQFRLECGPKSSFMKEVQDFLQIPESPEYIWQNLVVPTYVYILSRGWDPSLATLQQAMQYALPQFKKMKRARSDKQRYRAIAIALLAHSLEDEKGAS